MNQLKHVLMEPGQWRHWPYLPVKRQLSEGRTQLGLILASDRGAVPAEAIENVVIFNINAVMLTTLHGRWATRHRVVMTMIGRALALGAYHHYVTPESAEVDGWQIDG